ncbi:MAG: APC family permease, partial [Ferroplasma sp.]
PLIFSLILAIAFLLSFYGNNGYFAAINYFLTGYVVISFLVVLLIRKTRRGFYDAIRFEYSSLKNKLPETNKD